MNILAVVLTIGIILGFGLLLYGAFFHRGEVYKSADNTGRETFDKIRLSIEEADATLSNINSVSSLIIEEIDIKYKELLFLYQMLEEKKKELLEQSSERIAEREYTDYNDSSGRRSRTFGEPEKGDSSVYSTNVEILEIGRKMDEIKRFPKLHNQEAILELYNKGYDVTDTAKTLGIGKGEVKLILGLNKVGVGYD